MAEQADNPYESDFPKIIPSAKRALNNAGYYRLDQLRRVSAAEIKALHGMESEALDALRQELHRRGWAFADEPAP